MIKNKKGISHIEVVLSFVIFIGFLIFLIAIFNPFKSQDEKGSYIESLEREIKDYTNVGVEFMPLNLNSVMRGCFWIDYEVNKIIAKDENENLINAYSKEGKIYADGNGKFYYVISSEEFSEKNFSYVSCSEIKEENYSIGLIRGYNKSSYAKLENLSQEYNSNYEGVKQKFKVPGSVEFSFSVRDTLNNPILQVTRNIPERLKVTAKDFPIEIVYSNGTIQYAMLNIREW